MTSEEFTELVAHLDARGVMLIIVPTINEEGGADVGFYWSGDRPSALHAMLALLSEPQFTKLIPIALSFLRQGALRETVDHLRRN